MHVFCSFKDNEPWVKTPNRYFELGWNRVDHGQHVVWERSSKDKPDTKLECLQGRTSLCEGSVVQVYMHWSKLLIPDLLESLDEGGVILSKGVVAVHLSQVPLHNRASWIHRGSKQFKHIAKHLLLVGIHPVFIELVNGLSCGKSFIFAVCEVQNQVPSLVKDRSRADGDGVGETC